MKIYLKIFSDKILMLILQIIALSSIAQNHFGLLFNTTKNIQKNFYSYDIGVQYFSKLSVKYKIILYREFDMGINSYNKINVKANLLGILAFKYVESYYKATPIRNSDDGWPLQFIVLGFIMPNGIMLTKKSNHSNIEYGIIFAPLFFEHNRFPNNKEMNNYSCELGFPIFIKTKRYQHFSIQLFTAYQKNLSSSNIRPANFSNDNFTIRINFSYIFGISKNQKYE